MQLYFSDKAFVKCYHNCLVIILALRKTSQVVLQYFIRHLTRFWKNEITLKSIKLILNDVGLESDLLSVLNILTKRLYLQNADME